MNSKAGADGGPVWLKKWCVLSEKGKKEGRAAQYTVADTRNAHYNSARGLTVMTFPLQFRCIQTRRTVLDLLKCLFIGHFLRSGCKCYYSTSLKRNTLVESFTSLWDKLPRILRRKEIERDDIRRQKRRERERCPEWKHVGLYLMIYLCVERQLYMWHWLRGSVHFNLCETVMPLCVHVRCINQSLHIGLSSEVPKPEKSDLS